MQHMVSQLTDTGKPNYNNKFCQTFMINMLLHESTVSILLVQKANAKGSVSGFEIAPPSKGGCSNKQLAVN